MAEENVDEKKIELDLKTVQEFLNSNDEGKKYLQSVVDSAVTKGLKTFEAETLPKRVDAKIKELYPEETESDKKMRVLSQELESFKNEAKREKLTNFALTEATKRGIPTSVIKFVVADDEQSTLANLEVFETEFFSKVDEKVDDKFRVGGRVVPQQTTTPRTTFTADDVAKMSPDEFKKNMDAIKASKIK
jgi:hypothetical protein